MSDITSIEINCADDGSFAVNRALWKEKLVEVYIVADKMALSDNIGNYVVSFWKENEDQPRDEMRVLVQGVLKGTVLSLLQSSSAASFPSVVRVSVRADKLSTSLCASIIKQLTNGAYARALTSASKYIASVSPLHVPELCELESIFFISAFQSGSAGAYLVKINDGSSSAVLKILLETDFLLHTDEEIFSFTARLAAMYREMKVLMTIPPHPNIIESPIALVTVSGEDGPAICGFLSRFHPGGTLADALDPFSKNHQPPSVTSRILWATQIVSAVHHLHRVAHTYHGDIKLDNVILSAEDDAVLIDFEQGRHANECLAPEAGGEWDVIANIPPVGNTTTLNSTTIHYVPYTAPERDDTWSAYEAWAEYPEALEGIEIFSLGDALRTLFEGTCPPDGLGSVIRRCMSHDPVARPKLDWILRETIELARQH